MSVVTVDIVLTTLSEVVDEVSLGLEPRKHLLRLHVLLSSTFLASCRWQRRGLLHVNIYHRNIGSEFKINFHNQRQENYLC